MNNLLHFLLCQSCRSLRSVYLGGPHIPLQKVLPRLTEYNDVIRWPLFLALPRAPQLQIHHWLYQL